MALLSGPWQDCSRGRWSEPYDSHPNLGGALGVRAITASGGTGPAESAEELPPLPGVAAPGSMAARVTQNRIVVAITDHRVLVFAHGAISGRPKQLLAGFDHAELVDINLQPGKMINNVRLVFVDGSGIEIEVTRLNDPSGFRRAWEKVSSG